MNNKNYISARDIAEDTRLNKSNYHHCYCEACRSTAVAIPKKRSHIIREWLKPKLAMTLAFLPLFPTLAHAETCTPTPDCASLGYTQTSCPDNKGVRCPWNTSLLYCGENGQKICADIGYSNTCTGANEIPSGKACADKYYASCSCGSGYELKNGKCEEKPQNGLAAGLYYCNGVVKGVQVGNEKLVVALDDLGEMDLSSTSSACSQYSFCGNTKGILPTKEQLSTIYHNISKVQSRLSSNSGTKFAFGTSYRSSTYDFRNDGGYYVVNPTSGNTIISTDDTYDYYVRCVLAL